MENKQFSKLDCGFICLNCKKTVEPLGYTSRDHCPHCLWGLHVDIFPGDRENECKGKLKPISVKKHKQSYQITYKCEKCGKVLNNIVADDDDYEQILSICRNIMYN